MRKILLACGLAVILFAACSKDNKTHCWEFITVVETIYVGMEEEMPPIKAGSSTQQCDLTEAQAENVVKSGTSETSMQVGLMTIVTRTSVTKRKL